MLKKAIVLFLSIVCIMGFVVDALHAVGETIVFVSRPDKVDPATGANPDDPFIADLQAAGYVIIRFYNTALENASQATLDTLNNADLVILGRSCDSGIYGTTHKAAWNAVKAPTMSIHLWNARSNRMNWFNSTAAVHNDSVGVVLPAIIQAAADPVFAGLTTTGTVPWAIGPYDWLNTKDAGNGHVLAISAYDSSVQFVRFDPWVEFYPGSVDRPAGHRTMIGNGNDNPTDASGQHIIHYYNFTDESKQVYMNEVARMVQLPKDVPRPKDIVFVSRPDKVDPATGANPDDPFIADLLAAGYNVIRFYNTALENASQATLDTLNNADLVICGRSCDSGIYGTTHKAAWNAVKAPMMSIHLWNARSSRMNWFNSTAAVHNDSVGVVLPAIVTAPDDPVFAGLTTTDTVPWAVGPYDWLNTKDAGNGQVLAISAYDSSVQFVRFDPWVEFYDGTGDRPAGYRSMIGNGNDNPTDASGQHIIHYYNFTDESKQVYMNEVARMVELPKDVPMPKDIVFVSRPDYLDPHTNAQPDLPMINDLRAAGYHVIKWYNTTLSTASQATVDTLLNADLVIMGRSTPSTMYQPPEREAWNNIPTPILNIELWNCRNSRLNWFNSANMANVDDVVDYDATLDVPDDPVFAGVTVTNGVVPWTFGPMSVLHEKRAGNGHVLARMASDSSVLFVRFDPWVEFYPGSVDRPAGYRTMIGNGSDNASDAVGKIYNYYNFTDESKKVFFAEIARMVNLPEPPPKPKQIVFVSRPDYFDQVNQRHPDQQFIDDLTDAGYDVTLFYNTSLSTASQATLDTLDNADLVIIGRSTPSTMVQQPNADYWNSVRAPMMILSVWSTRNSRIDWFNSGTCTQHNTDTETINAVINVPNDPVFAGLTLTDGKLPWAVPPYDVIQITDAGNGTVLASDAADGPAMGAVLFARFDPWVKFYEGSVSHPAGYRTLIGNGNDATTNADGLTVYNYYNFTPESRQVWLAEVARMVDLGKAESTLPTAVEAANGVPFTYELDQNYPNPFNPSTEIEFSLAKSGQTTVQVYNVMGQLVQTLMDKKLEAGNHSINFRADHLSSGVYFYSIKSGEFSQVKKMMLLK
jgi:fructose-specific component phosphotransferase system IIB-like protein